MLFTPVKMHTIQTGGIYDARIIRYSSKRARQCKQNRIEKIIKIWHFIWENIFAELGI